MKFHLEIDTTNPHDTEHAARIVAALTSALSPYTDTPHTMPSLAELNPSAAMAFREVVDKTPEPEKPKRASRAKKPAPTAVEVDNVKVAETTRVEAPEPEADETPMALAEPEAPAAEVTLKDLQAVGKALIVSGPDGREKLRATLAEYDVARLSDLDPQAWAQVADKIKEATK